MTGETKMYQIGELAKACGINHDTLRFYEKNALLTPSHRSESGYRLYTEKDKEILQFILRAKSVGFTLAEIRELLSIEIDKANNACADVKVLVDTKLSEVEKTRGTNTLPNIVTTPVRCVLWRHRKRRTLHHT